MIVLANSARRRLLLVVLFMVLTAAYGSVALAAPHDASPFAAAYIVAVLTIFWALRRIDRSRR